MILASCKGQGFILILRSILEMANGKRLMTKDL